MRKVAWYCAVMVGLTVFLSIYGFLIVESLDVNQTLTGRETSRLFGGWFVVLAGMLAASIWALLLGSEIRRKG